MGLLKKKSPIKNIIVEIKAFGELHEVIALLLAKHKFKLG